MATRRSGGRDGVSPLLGPAISGRPIRSGVQRIPKTGELGEALRPDPFGSRSLPGKLSRTRGIESTPGMAETQLFDRLVQPPTRPGQVGQFAVAEFRSHRPTSLPGLPDRRHLGEQIPRPAAAEQCHRAFHIAQRVIEAIEEHIHSLLAAMLASSLRSPLASST